MADPPLPRTASDDLITRILGWSPARAGASSDSCDWKRLHLQIRITADGIDAFNRAIKLLSGEEGRILFKRGDVCSSRDPLLVVHAYFRLLRLSLEPTDGDSPVTENEWTQHTKALLKNLGSSLKSSIQQQIQHLNDSLASQETQQTNYNRSDCKQRNDTVLLYFHSIMDHVVPHVGRKNAILGSTYKIFSELAELFVTLLELECIKLRGLIQSLLPVVGWPALFNLQEDVNQINSTWDALNNCLKQAGLSLVQAMNEGMVPVQRALEGVQGWNSKPEAYSRIIVFMMARAVSLIFLRRKRFEMYNTGASGVMGAFRMDSRECSDDGEAELISQCLLLLIRIRSISVIAHGCLKDSSTQSQLDDGRIKLFEMLVGLGQKVDMYVAKLLCLDAGSSGRGDSTRMGLDCLANLPADEFNITLNVSRDVQLTTSENIIPLGRLFVVKHVLGKLKPASSFASASLIRLCQFTVFQDMPRLFHIFQIRSPHGIELPVWSSKLICDLVDSVSDCTRALFLDEVGNSLNAMIRQHQLLLRWLAGSANLNHPFTNEIVMGIILRRIATGNKDRTYLLSLMARLLFHPRTEAAHRDQIATVLSRLLRPSEVKSSLDDDISSTKIATIQVMWRELKKSTLFNSHSKNNSSKRKRKANFDHSPVVEEFVVYEMLELLAEASSLSRVAIDGAVESEIKQLWGIILAGSGRNSKDKVEGKHCAGMSLFAGLMRCQPSIASIQFMIHSEIVIQSVCPSSFIDGSLALVNSIFSSRRNRSRTSHLYAVCLQFIDSLVSFLGSEFSESHITFLGCSLKSISSEKSPTSASTKARLQHLAAYICCRSGAVVKPSFSSESVKVRPMILSYLIRCGRDFTLSSPCSSSRH